MEELTPSAYQGIRRRASQLLRRYGDFRDAPQTVSLFNRAFLRLEGGNLPPLENRDHFFAVWTRAMRSILIDLYRRDRLVRKMPIQEDLDAAEEKDSGEFEVLHKVLCDLAEAHPHKALIVELRYFDGCTWTEIASLLDLTRHALEKEWHFASAWVRRELKRRE